MELTKPASPKYIALLALVACLILVVGWFARPRDIPQNPAPIPSETELEQLARRAERRSLESMTKYFGRVAGDVSTSLAYVRGAAASGLVWDEQRLISGPLSESQPSVTVRVAGSSVETAVAPDLWGPNLPLAVMRTPQTLGAMTVARRAASLPQSGDWVVAVWRTDGPHAFAPANFRQAAATRCGQSSVTEIVSSVSLSRSMIGGGLFNIDGGLLGVILPCRDHIAAIETASIDAILARVDTLDQRLLARYGISVAPLSNEEKPYFKVEAGLLVREVWNESRADDAGVWPGDIITGIDGRPVVVLDDLRELTTFSDTPFGIAVQRGAKMMTFALTFSPEAVAPGGEPTGAGVTLDSGLKTFRIDSVAAGGRAARAGIEVGDRVIRIDRSEPRSAQQIQRILSTNQPSPMLLEFERGGRRIATVVQGTTNRE